MAKRYYRRKKSSEFSRLLIGVVILVGFVGLISNLLPRTNLPIVALTIIASIFVIVVGLSILLYVSYKNKKRLRAFTLSHVDDMTGVEFEQYLGDILKSQGYSVKYTPTTGDFGTDIIAQKAKKRYSIQAKRYREKVGPPAIQQAVTALKVYQCDQAIVVTNSYYTKEAKELAKYNDCQLIDRDLLADWIFKYQKTKVKFL